MTILRYDYQGVRLLEELKALAKAGYGLTAKVFISLRHQDYLTIGDYKIYILGSIYKIKQERHPAVTRSTPEEVLRFIVKPAIEPPPLFEFK